MINNAQFGDSPAIKNDAQVGDVSYAPEDLEKFYAGKISEKELKSRAEKRAQGEVPRTLEAVAPPPPLPVPRDPDLERAQKEAAVSQAVDAANTQEAPPATRQVEATQGAIDRAKELGIDLTLVKGTGKGGKVTKSDVDKVAVEVETPPPPPPAPPSLTDINATESAKDEAALRGVDLTTVEGTGEGGRITKSDVEKAAPEPPPPPPIEDESTT